MDPTLLRSSGDSSKDGAKSSPISSKHYGVRSLDAKEPVGLQQAATSEKSPDDVGPTSLAVDVGYERAWQMMGVSTPTNRQQNSHEEKRLLVRAYGCA